MYLYLKGKIDKEIFGELAGVYGSSAPSYAQVLGRGIQTWKTRHPDLASSSKDVLPHSMLLTKKCVL